jgi:hypothetical protein
MALVPDLFSSFPQQFFLFLPPSLHNNRETSQDVSVMCFTFTLIQLLCLHIHNLSVHFINSLTAKNMALSPPPESSSPLSSLRPSVSPPSPSWVAPPLRRVADASINLNFAASPVIMADFEQNADPGQIATMERGYHPQLPKGKGGAMDVVTNHLEKLLQESGEGGKTADEKENLRVHIVLFNVLKSLKDDLPGNRTTDDAGEPVVSRTHEPIVIDIKNLAIGRLLMAEAKVKHPLVTRHFSEVAKFAYQLSVRRFKHPSIPT